MENISLSPGDASAVKLTEGDGGSYYAWNSTIFPFLEEAEVSVGFLILKSDGFALPHYADCNKIGYVIQGTEGIAGLLDPVTSEEKAVKLKQGDAIVVPVGCVSWWSNAGNDELKIIFLAQNVKDHGQITYCILTGPIGILKAFPPATISKTFDITQEQAKELTDSQTKPLIIKLQDAKPIQKLSNKSHTKALCYNFSEKATDIHVKKGGSFSSLTDLKHCAMKGLEISGNLLKLEPKAMFGPTYYAKDSGVQLSYVVNGSGWVRVVSMTGKVVLDTPLKEGQIFGVPKFFLVSIGAGDDGIECFSIVNASKPVLGEIAGKTSVWNVLSPEVLQASLKISPEFCKTFKEKINKSSIITPA